jgi:hypothetical protein
MVFAYHAHDDAEMLAFDARITDEYTAFYATRGVRYSGVYRAEALGLRCLGEILAFAGVHSAKEGEKLGSEDLSPRIVEIEDECRTYQDREAARFSMWLLPSGGA